MFRERGSATGTHRLSTHRRIKEYPQAADEEGTGGDTTILGKPKGGGEGKEAIAGGKVSTEVLQGVVAELVLMDHDAVSLEKGVSFVVGQMVFVAVVVHKNGGTFGDLTPVTNRLVVQESKFAET